MNEISPQTEIVAAVRQRETRQTGWLTQIAIALGTMLLFIGLGVVVWDAVMVLLLVLVLLIHECGHFLAMRWFGYRNIKMFFVPMLGAAVSGRHFKIASWKKAIVALAGPVPSLVIATLCLLLGVGGRDSTSLTTLAGLMWVLNVLNLLPLLPLDGGQTSLPTMFHDSERPRNVWSEQLALAERIGAADAPALIPDDVEARVEMFGLCAVVLGEDGLVWNMRILADSPLARKYGYSEEASAAAADKIAGVLRLLDARLAAQSERGSPYLVGDAITAIDVYWATMSIAMMVPGPEIMPVTRQNQRMLQFFGMNKQIPAVGGALTERLEAHQRYILTTYCETPAVLGGDPL
ncbi:MAG: site-2 protease family protein [Planctomycetota bacterium]